MTRIAREIVSYEKDHLTRDRVDCEIAKQHLSEIAASTASSIDRYISILISELSDKVPTRKRKRND